MDDASPGKNPAGNLEPRQGPEIYGRFFLVVTLCSGKNITYEKNNSGDSIGCFEFLL